MALNIGTNISYQGQHFLDQRQEATNLSSLRTWSIPVPDGFEVYCEGKWYVWKSDYQSAVTGHFKLRIDNEVENSQIQNEVDTNTNDIQHLQDAVYPLEFRNVSGGGVYKVGSQIIPEISWELWKDNEKIVADSVEVTVNGLNDSRGVLASKERYVGSKLLPNEASVIYLTAIYKNQRKTLEVLYNLVPKKYLILSTTKELSNPYKTIESWAGATTLEKHNTSPIDSKYSLDCRGKETEGGLYIHYVIPSTYFPGEDNLQSLVGGLEMSDYDVIDLPNYKSDYPERYRDYKDLCFNNKQNGLLNIEFKEVVYQTY